MNPYRVSDLPKNHFVSLWWAKTRWFGRLLRRWTWATIKFPFKSIARYFGWLFIIDTWWGIGLAFFSVLSLCLLTIGLLGIGMASLAEAHTDCSDYRTGLVQDGVDEQGRAYFVKHNWCAKYKPGREPKSK
jgi:hypothetical protein